MPTTSKRRKSSVCVQYAVPRRGLPGAVSFRKWSRATSPCIDVVLRIVGTREGRQLNRTYRGKDTPTNVLSFAYGASGDIVLCHPVIAREARSQRKHLAAHYAHLVVHGLLHLGGDDHQGVAQAGRMERREIALLAQLGFGNPYAVR